MANTFSQIYLHITFSTKKHQIFIPKENRDGIYKYITGIIKKRGQKLYIVNGTGDHIHLLISIKPDITVSSMVKEIKVASNEYINSHKLTPVKFQWQDGFGVFSVSPSILNATIEYIKNQEEHHRTKTYIEEYEALLKIYDIEYNPRYLDD